ncbi:MAG: Flp family type IVb pilin [Aestuariivirga sp.]
MKTTTCQARLFLSDSSGATAIEYGLIAAAMGLMLIPVMFTLTSTVQSTLFDVMTGLFTGFN